MIGRLHWEWHLWRTRWLVLLFIGAWVGSYSGPEEVHVYFLLAALALLTVGYNLLLWRLLHGEDRRWHPVVSLCGDMVLITAGVHLAGWDTPLLFLYLLPLTSAFVWYGALVALTGFLVVFAGSAVAGWWTLPEPEQVRLLSRGALLGLLTFAGAFLVSEERRRALELASLQRIAQTIAWASQWQKALQQLVTAVCDILEAEKVLFLLYDATSDELVAQFPAVGVSDEELRLTRVPRGEGVTWHVFASGQPYLVRDARRDPRISQRFAKVYGARSVLSVPLQINERTIGVVHAVNKRAQQPFTSGDCQLLTLVASQIALLLENARLHESLERERTTLSAVLHSVASGVIVTDAQGDVVLINPNAEHLFHVSERESQGQPLEAVVPEPAVLAVLEGARARGETVTEEITLDHRGNTVVRVDCTPVTDESGMILGQVAVFHDVTEQRRLDQMKGEFISQVSHELRTPLTSIKAFAATLLRDVEFDRDTQREFLGIINSQCDRLNRHINDLLHISRIESGRPVELRYAPVDVGAVVQRVVRAESLFTNKHRFQTEVQPEAATIEADEDKLARILTNLLNNAIKYSPDGGTVTVTVRAENDEVVFAVRDEGIGIPEHQRTAIFDKFYQVDRSRTRRVGGSGVGLFLVKQLVEAHQGSIWVESEVGCGSTFLFRLPRCRRVPPASRTVVATPAPAPLSETANSY